MSFPHKKLYARRTCRRKVRYTDPRVAWRDLINLTGAGDICTGLNVYECDWCGGLHLGKRRMPRSAAFYAQARKPIILKLLQRTLDANSPQHAEKRTPEPQAPGEDEPDFLSRVTD